MLEKSLTHPCFVAEARHQYGRIHLPVAPKCNVQCNFCNRKYDCINESRPGVTSAVLSPRQALAYLKQYLKFNSNISTVGIAGPGDPLANPVETLETIRLIHDFHPEMIFCLSTNGLQLAPYIEELKSLGVSHITITLNAVDPEIGAKIYSWIRDGKVIYRDYDGAALLLERQLSAIVQLKELGFTVKINTIIIPGINDSHIPAVAEKAAALGADVMNCIPILPAQGSNFAHLQAPSHDEVEQIRSQTSVFMKQIKHCARCRADAAGLIGEKTNPAVYELLTEASALPLNPEQHRPYIAVTTMEGMLINQHLGEANQIHIYRLNDNAVEFVETRPAPLPGGGENRWKELNVILADCHSLLVNGIGKTPMEILKAGGIKVYETEGMIDRAILNLTGGKPLQAKACVTKCGFTCKGNGLGCG